LSAPHPWRRSASECSPIACCSQSRSHRPTAVRSSDRYGCRRC